MHHILMLNFPDSLTHHEINLYKSLKRVVGRHIFFKLSRFFTFRQTWNNSKSLWDGEFFLKNIQLMVCTCNTPEFLVLLFWFLYSKMTKCFEGLFAFLYPTGTRHSISMDFFLLRFSKALCFHPNYKYQQHHVIPLNIYPEQDCSYPFFIRWIRDSYTS